MATAIGTPTKYLGDSLVLLLLLRTENGVNCSATDRAGTLQRGLSILCRNPLGVLHIGLLFALHTIILICHVKVASLSH